MNRLATTPAATEAMLQAGIHLLQDTAERFHHIRPGEIAFGASVHVNKFFDTWPTTRSFHADLTERILSPANDTDYDRLADKAVELHVDGRDIKREWAGLYIGHLMHSEWFLPRMAIGHDQETIPDAAEGLSRYYSRQEACASESFHEVMGIETPLAESRLIIRSGETMALDLKRETPNANDIDKSIARAAAETLLGRMLPR